MQNNIICALYPMACTFYILGLLSICGQMIIEFGSGKVVVLVVGLSYKVRKNISSVEYDTLIIIFPLLLLEDA